MHKNFVRCFFIGIAMWMSTQDAFTQEARLLRFPTISNGKIVFSYAGDRYKIEAIVQFIIGYARKLFKLIF